MNSRERIQAALRHQAPDRTPIFEYVLLAPVADQILGRLYMGDFSRWGTLVEERGWHDAVRQIAVDVLDLALVLEHDMIYSIPSPPMPRKPSNEKQLPRPVVSDDPVERVRYRNQCRAEASDKPTEDTLEIYPLLKSEMKKCGVDLPLLAPAYAHGIWTDVDLMQTMLLAPEVAQEHFSLCTQSSLERIKCYVELGVDQIGIGGDFAGNRPLISPQLYRELIVPEIRICSGAVHDAGCWAINASDGDLWSVIDDFLLATEVDGYLEIDMQAGMDLARLKALYGDRVTLYGNMDCGNVLSFASPEEIRRQTIQCLEAGLGNGGHIFCANNAITASVPIGNYLAMIAAYREFFNLPPLRF